MKKLLLAGVATLIATAAVGVYLNPAWLAGIQGERTAPDGASIAEVAPRAGNAPTIPTASPPTAAAEAGSSLPFAESTTNVAAEELGGHVDHASGSYGSGYFGKRLIDGSTELTWTSSATLPLEAIFSFYDRQPALITAVSIVLPEEAASAPKDVEVWTSTEDAAEKFVKAAAQTLAPQPIEQKIAFPAVEARYVKLRILSTASGGAPAVRDVRILEASRAGYTPLFDRSPDMKSWNRSPRQAAQRGLDWLQQSAVDWQKLTECFGCHVQAQVIMGQAIATKQNYVVSSEAFAELEKGTRQRQDKEGSWFGGYTSPTAFAVMALAYADEHNGAKDDPALLKGLDWLLTHQAKDGSVPVDRLEPPIVEGSFMTTTNGLVALMRAHEVTRDPKYLTAAERALAWIAGNQPETHQDRVFKTVALTRFGTPEMKLQVAPMLEQLGAAQQPDGGWKERPEVKGSNALATGQALYALKQGGASVYSTMFTRGVSYLLNTQTRNPQLQKDGSWPAENTQSGRPSDFAHTMWAVIGLAGSYGVSKMGGLQVVTNLQQAKPTSRNLEIVLDVSGSMKASIGKSTRWQTALVVLEQVMASVPDDFNVGLRVYGHRYSSASPQTCADTELVVPLVKLDRQRILATAKRYQPRGETPLIRSVLQTVDDLRTLGSGSVILITDGEESCHGDPTAAANQLKAAGVDVTLNIVGFTLKGKAVEEQLGALAESTGGRYYGAQSGEELAKALKIAAIRSFPYEIFDASDKLVATRETSTVAEALPPGNYRVTVHALGQTLTENASVAAGQDTVLKVVLKGGQFAIER